MKVLFLNPPFKPDKGKFSRTSRSPAITRAETIYYPFWLASAAGVLDRAGFEVYVIDSPAKGYNLEHTKEKALKIQPKLIVIDTSTASIYSDVKTAEHLKQVLPQSFIVLVGTHPSALPEQTLKLSGSLDGAAKGEYDYTIRDLAAFLKNKKDLRNVDGLVFREKNEIIHNRPRALIENLDELPFVSQVYKKYFDIRKYFFAASDHPMVMIITGRGCPFRCFFCLYPQTFHSRRYRLRSPQSVVDEFEYIAKALPKVKEIGIEDDTFTANRKRAQEICRLIIERKIKIKWYCNVRVDLDLETMKQMKKAGCKLLTVGFESANQDVLNNMRKGMTVKQIRQFVKDTKKAKLLVHGCFMAGNPGETRQTLQQNLDLAKELNCDSMQFYPLMVYPGTEAYQWAKSNGYLTTSDFSKWATDDGTYNCLLNLPGLKREQIVDWCNKATKEYYIRPAYIFMKLKQMVLHPREIKRTFKSAKTFFKHLF